VGQPHIARLRERSGQGQAGQRGVPPSPASQLVSPLSSRGNRPRSYAECSRPYDGNAAASIERPRRLSGHLYAGGHGPENPVRRPLPGPTHSGPGGLALRTGFAAGRSHSVVTNNLSRRCGRPRNIVRMQTRPIHSINQRGELRRRQPHHAVRDWWPPKRTLFQPLPIQHQARRTLSRRPQRAQQMRPASSARPPRPDFVSPTLP
jgi:hypothetical protein